MSSERELVARVAATGDARAFEALVRAHQLAVRRFLLRLTGGDAATADDLAQETFLTAYRKMHTFQGASALGTWLHTIAYRQFIAVTRQRKREVPMAEVPDGGRDERAALEGEVLARQLMAQLCPEDRACLTLAYSAGLSHAEIARVMEQPLGSVKARIHRAKLKLNRWLEDHDHTVHPPTADRDRRRAR